MKKENRFLAKAKSFLGVQNTQSLSTKRDLIRLSQEILAAHSLETNCFKYEDAFGTQEVKDADFLVFFSSEWSNIEHIISLYYEIKQNYGHFPRILFVDDTIDVVTQKHHNFMIHLTKKTLKELSVMPSHIICSNFGNERHFIVDRVGNDRAIMVMGARKSHYKNQLALHFKKCPNKGKLAQYLFYITDLDNDRFYESYGDVDEMSFLKDINKIALDVMENASPKYAIDFVNKYEGLEKEFNSFHLYMYLWSERQALRMASRLLIMDNKNSIRKNY